MIAMDEHSLREKLNELSLAYPDLLEEYDNDYTWTENRIIKFRNDFPGE
jgi:hypothetical protein